MFQIGKCAAGLELIDASGQSLHRHQAAFGFDGAKALDDHGGGDVCEGNGVEA